MDVREILKKFDEMLAQGRVREAGAFLEEMAADCKEKRDGVAAITILNELEGFWRAAGQKEKSFAAAREALALIAASGMEGSVGHATTLLNYATAKTAFGEPSEALELYRRVEAIYSEELPTDDYRFASLWNNMAQALLRQGDAKTAADFFEKSLKILEESQDVETEKATCRTNIALCLMAQKKLDEARAHLDCAEGIFSSVGENPHYDNMLACRGQLEYIQGEFAKAADYYSRAASNVEKRFGRNRNYAALCRNCAKALTAAGREEEAALYAKLAESAEIRQEKSCRVWN